MMEFKNIKYEKSGGVGTITLNRPEKLNALHFELLDELWTLLQDILVDNDVKVVLLTGEGRFFSAGADLEILSSLSSCTFRLHQHKYWNRVFCELEDMQKLTIAAINGPAIGGGVELALCCDLRYAVDEATFRMPQINFGLLPDAGATTRLPWLMGLARAKEFILSGDTITAAEAKENGLVNRIFPREIFYQEVQKITDKMVQKSASALGMGKQIINRSFQQRDVKFGLEEITDVQSILISSEDYKEGINEFMNKIKPDSSEK